jgi:hypothetical protein
MKKFLRFTALVTLAAFIGLGAVESFHSHAAHQTTANCPICQIAHKTPAITASGAVVMPHWVSARAYLVASVQPIVDVAFVAHGLSPPLA